MIDLSSLAVLKGKKALVTGIANDQSIAWGCAKAFHAFGADLAITYHGEKTKRYVDPPQRPAEPLAQALQAQREGRGSVPRYRQSSPGKGIQGGADPS